MDKDWLTRRHFLQKTGIASGAVLSYSLLEPLIAHAATPFVRKDVGTLSASDPILVSYAAAIAQMQTLNPDNPLSWAFQAAIHGTPWASATPGEVATWNTCQHNPEFFLSWHRMYLYYFERIIRSMSGNSSWALPYWNYELSSESALPAAFWNPADSSNALYTCNRGPGWNDGTQTLSPSAVSTTIVLSAADVPFVDFSEDLYGTPHVAVHLAIGGWMGAVQTAAQDPIFFLHHCNIDRLWNLWLAQGGGRSDPLSDSAWTTKPFTFFDETGKQVTMTGCDILRAQDQLNYVYDMEPPQVNEYCDKVFPFPHRIYFPWFVLWPGPVTVPPSLGPQTFSADVPALAQHLSRTPIASFKAGTSIVLRLTEVQADHQPNVYYEVYVGLPKGMTPAFEDAHYVGNLAMFGRGVRDMQERMKMEDRNTRKTEDEAGQYATFTFKITHAVEAAMKGNKSLKQLDIAFVPRGGVAKGRFEERKPTATIHIGRAEIGLESLE